LSMGYMLQAEYYSYRRMITNPFDIERDEIIPDLLKATHLSH
jgi:hypothetical protein